MVLATIARAAVFILSVFIPDLNSPTVKRWDQHSNLPKNIATQCKETDQASAGLILDLKQRGLLEDTLVIWGGEFGRTSYSQGRLTETNYGRDHHPRSFTIFMAGAGVKRGFTYGETDDFGFNIIQNPFMFTISRLL